MLIVVSALAEQIGPLSPQQDFIQMLQNYFNSFLSKLCCPTSKIYTICLAYAMHKESIKIMSKTRKFEI